MSVEIIHHTTVDEVVVDDNYKISSKFKTIR